MAARILDAGYSVVVYARNPSKAQALLAQGAHLASSPQELAERSDVVFSIVGNSQDVRSLVLGPAGVLSGLKPGGVAVDMTSSHPALAREIFTAARAKECWSVDAPVSGADVGAREGRLAIFAGGDGGVVAWLMPLFKIMGKVTHMGDSGCGQSCKIANQITGGANLVGLSEGLVFAERAGLNLGQFLEAIKDGAGGSRVMELFGKKMIEDDFRPTGFVEYIVKDLGMGLDVVEENEEDDRGRVVVLPGAALNKQLFSGMLANGDGKLGIHGVITVIKRLNGKS